MNLTRYDPSSRKFIDVIVYDFSSNFRLDLDNKSLPFFNILRTNF
jgi:hypothetical protein